MSKIDLLQLSYGVFKSISSDSPVFWTQDTGGISLYAGIEGHVCKASTSDIDEIADFETRKIAQNRAYSQHDAMALSITATGSKFRQSVLIQAYAKRDRNMSLVGKRTVCTLNAITETAFQFNAEREIQGIDVEVMGWTDGDFIEVYAELPVAPTEQNPNPSRIKLIQWTETVYIPTSGKLSYSAQEAKMLPAGIVICIEYRSIATTGPEPVLYTRVCTWK